MAWERYTKPLTGAKVTTPQLTMRTKGLIANSALCKLIGFERTEKRYDVFVDREAGCAGVAATTLGFYQGARQSSKGGGIYLKGLQYAIEELRGEKLVVGEKLQWIAPKNVKGDQAPVFAIRAVPK